MLMRTRRTLTILATSFALSVPSGTTVFAQMRAIRGTVTLPEELAPVARRPDITGLAARGRSTDS